MKKEVGVVKPENKSLVKIRDEIKSCRELVEGSYLKMGDLLSQVYKHKLYKTWKFDSFKDYVEQDLGFKERKAFYLICVWKTFSQDLKFDATELTKIGWSKAATLIPVVTVENAKDWVEKAKTLSCTDLEELVKSSKTTKKIPANEIIYKMTFGLYEGQKEIVEQALTKVGVEADSDVKSRQLELLALNYLAGVTDSANQPLQHWISKLEKAYKVTLVAVKDGVPLNLPIEAVKTV